MSDPDIAALLFPTSDTLGPAAASQSQPAAPTPPDAASIMFGGKDTSPVPAQRPGEGGHPLAKAFHSEAAPDVAASVADTLNPWAESLQLEGKDAQAEEMRAVSEALSEDFRQSGMTQDDVSEVMGLAREALGNSIMPGMPVSEERLLAGHEKAMAFIEENQISPHDIDLAQRLVADLDAKTEGQVSAYLIDTGMGNNPRTIAKAVEIAKRRYGR